MESEPRRGPAGAIGRSISLRRYLLAAFAAMVAGVLLIAGVSWGMYSFARNRREAGLRLQETAYLSSLRLGTYLERHRQLVVMLAREIDESGSRDEVVLGRIMQRARETNPGLLTMLVTAADGRIVATSPRVQGQENQVIEGLRSVSDRSYFTGPSQTGLPHVSNVFRGRGFGTDPIVAISAPLHGPGGTFDGVLEGSLNLSRLDEFEAGRGMITAGDIVMIDGSGKVVYATDKLRHPPLTEFTDVRFEPAQVRLARAAITEGGLRATGGLEAKDVLVGWAPVQVTGMERSWTMAVLQDQAAMRALLWRQLGYLMVGLAAALVVASIVAHRLARRLTRPIERLAEVARQVARAPDESKPLELGRTQVSEIREMQEDISAMHGRWIAMVAQLKTSLAEQEAMAVALRDSRGALELSHRQLEQRVVERTVELRETVERLSAEVTRRSRGERRLEENSRLMELIAVRAPLAEVLHAIVGSIERDDPEMIASIMLLDGEGRRLHHGASLRLAADYRAAIEGLEIGPAVGSCGSAAYLRRRVIVTDIATDARWLGFRELALASGLHACWSTPIMGGDGELLGTFAIYYRQPTEPKEEHLWMVEMASHTAAVAIERHDEEVAREQIGAELRRVHKLEALGTLAGGVAHGFNNLLVPILSYAEIVGQDPKLGAVARAQLQEIVQSARRARGLVQQLLAFSRQQAPQWQPVDLVPLITDTVRLLRGSAAANVSITTEIVPERAVVAGDGAQLQQLLLNIGTNAIQALHPAGGRVAVTLRRMPARALDGLVPDVASQSHYYCLDVADTGPGIAPEVRDRIFDPFFTTKPVGAGSGLGLAVVHGIVGSHRGVITVESEQGQGALFRVCLPAGNEVWPGPAEIGVEQPVLAGVQGRVMMVDDEPVVARAAASMLRSHGCEVEVFDCAESALERLRSAPMDFDLVVSDVTMPGMSGVDFAILAGEVRPDLNFLLITGHGRLDESRLQRRTARHKVLGKPFDRDVLLRAVDELLPRAKPTGDARLTSIRPPRM